MAIAAVAAATLAAAPQAGAVSIETLSNRADLVSGGDALVAVDAPKGVRITLGARDVTPAFARRGGRLEGLVEGLRVGDNVLTAQLPDGSGATLTITNHPIGGPIFSGPQITPWYCLDGALDKQCNRPTTYTWQYKSSRTGSFAAYDPANPPDDVAMTTTDQGKTVPYVVRLETGNMDRSQYKIAVLADPTKPVGRPSGPPAWNHKVWVEHGAGCGLGHSEGAAPEVMVDGALSRGFAALSTALEHNTENCNVVVQAESVMMAKEHLVERYGDVRYLIGHGCSGGSIAQLHMANAYPGLYDGLTVSCTYPDIPVNDLIDCSGLLRYWDSPTAWSPGVVWTEPQQAAAAGLASTSVCRAWIVTFSGMFDPRVGVECDVPGKEPEKVYDPATNPRGLRCTFQDYLGNIFGLRPADRWGPVEKKIGRGFANRPYDNVGVQYGLRALLARDITPAQFVDLNAAVGAVDIDYGKQPERVEADPAAITRAYRSGVLDEGNNLDKVAIIDQPIPGDRYEIHDNYKSWALRARLDAANGHHGNHAIWYGADGYFQDAFGAMDGWLSAIERDRSDASIEQKIVKDRPDSVRDTCEIPTRSLCDQGFGPVGNIRWGAGMPTLANDVIKCRLAPLRRNDYAPILFADAEWDRLRKAFPSGVCDFDKPGVGQQGAVAWQTYENGPGGRPLGPAPRSRRLG